MLVIFIMNLSIKLLLQERSTNFTRFVLYFVKIVHSKGHYQGLVASNVFLLFLFYFWATFFVFILVSFCFFFNNTHCVLMMLCHLALFKLELLSCQHLSTLPSSNNICHLLLNFANVSYHCGVVSIAINAKLKWTL